MHLSLHAEGLRSNSAVPIAVDRYSLEVARKDSSSILNEIIKICYSCVDLMDHRPLFASPNDCQDFDVCCDETREILEETYAETATLSIQI